MPSIEALAEVDSLMPCNKIPWSKIAEKHGVVRSTLTRRYRAQTRSREEQAIAQRNLTPQQEAELLRYIESLTERHLPPTREMIQEFGSAIAGKPVSIAWVQRFLHRHHDQLSSQWTLGMDAKRHTADNGDKYNLYFELLQTKIAEYDVEAENTYNMYEKGFMIGVVGKSKRIFSKRLYSKKQYQELLQDGSCEWITLLACICADGSWLPPGLIFEAAGRAIQSSWMDEIDAAKHSVFVTTSPSGWTNDDVGLAWLEQVFDRYTGRKHGEGIDY